MCVLPSVQASVRRPGSTSMVALAAVRAEGEAAHSGSLSTRAWHARRPSLAPREPHTSLVGATPGAESVDGAGLVTDLSAGFPQIENVLLRSCFLSVPGGIIELMFGPREFDADAVLGPASAETIALLLAVDPEALDRDDAVAAAAGFELAKRLLDGLQLRCLASAAGKRREPGELSEVGQELSAATNMHWQTASCRTDLACSAVDRLPRPLGLLQAGRYTLGHVDQIERATRELTDEQARRVDRQMPARPVGLKRRLAEAIAAVDREQLN